VTNEREANNSRMTRRRGEGDEMTEVVAAQSESKRQLLAKLEGRPDGLLSPDLTTEVLSYIAENWHVLVGDMDRTSMTPRKIWRAERVFFTHPGTVSFTIERHGAFMCGSKYAEIHAWDVDLLNDSAVAGNTGKKRLLVKLDKRFNAKEAAREVAEKVLAHDTETPLLIWKAEDDVRIDIAEVVPATNKQTTSSRRRRFRDELYPLLEAQGWVPTTMNRFRHNGELRVLDDGPEG